MKITKISTFLFLAVCAALLSEKVMAAGVNLPEVGLPNPSGGLVAVVEGLVKWLLGIFGFLAILSFIISGVMYLTSAGDDAAMKKAKNQMKWSVIGVVVGLMGYIIIVAIDSALKGNGLG